MSGHGPPHNGGPGASNLVTVLFNAAATSVNFGWCAPCDAIGFAFDRMQEEYPLAFAALCIYLESISPEGDELLREALPSSRQSGGTP